MIRPNDFQRLVEIAATTWAAQVGRGLSAQDIELLSDLILTALAHGDDLLRRWESS